MATALDDPHVAVTAEAVAAYEDLASSTMRSLQIIPKPTIAMIRGYCIGGGVALATRPVTHTHGGRAHSHAPLADVALQSTGRAASW